MTVPVDYQDIAGAGKTSSLNQPQFRYMMQDSRWRLLYPAPYFDPIAMQTLMDPKIMMHWGRYFYDWHPIIHAAINKMVSYPITDFIFETSDSNVEQDYKKIFEAINVRSVLIRMGLDYFVSGNAYFSLIMPFSRMLECPECHASHNIDSKDINLTIDSLNLRIVCPTCKKSVVPEIKDATTQDYSKIRPILWDPLNMKVDYDELLNQSDYLYSFPGYIASNLNRGDKKLWSTYPMYMVNAARNKKLLKLFPTKVLHLKRDTHSSAYNKGYGQPMISPVLKYLFHLLVLLRAQDALAIDQILPWTIISPSSNGSVDPSGEMDLGMYARTLENEYKEWKLNPLRKSMLPIPVNAQIIGAQGKALMLTNEIQEITNQILAGMGVPSEFVYGGLQWSGANVSLRMLENQFINYRNMMQQVLDYIVEQCHTNFNLPNIKVRLQAFKMADDIAQKDLLLRLAEGGLISKRTVLKELFTHIDYDKEQEYIEEERAQQRQTEMSDMIARQNASYMYGVQPPADYASGSDMGETQHGDLPSQRPPRSEGGNAQI